MQGNWNQGAPQPPPGYPSAGAAAPTTSAAYPAIGDDDPKKPQGAAFGQPGAYPGAGAPPPMMMPPVMMPARPPLDPESQQMDADVAFATASMRNAFARKVFAVVALQLLVTAGVAAACMYGDGVRATVLRHPGMYYAAWGVSFISIMVISCVEKARRSFPLNIIMLGVFTLSMAFLVGMITAFHSVEAVMLAFVVTFAAVAALTIFAINTKIDATKWGSVLFAGLIIVIVLSIIGIFWRQRILYLAIAGVSALLFSAYLVYDVQAIMGGRRGAYSPDDWVAAALALYLDVINLFLAILQIIGLTSNN